MKNLPIFTVRNPELSRWQSFIEQLLKDKNPDLSIAEIRNSPMMQGCWTHVKLAMEGKQPKAPEGALDPTSIGYNAYASTYFFEAIQALGKTEVNKKSKTAKNAEESSSDIDAWPYSTDDTWNWLSTSAGRYYITGYWNYYWHGDFYSDVTYRDYKEDGNGDIDYSVIDWTLPANARIALIGDWGTENDDAHEFLRALISGGVDCIIHLGDVYYTGTKNECIDKFLNVIRNEIGSQVPVFTIPGNHEYYSFGEGFYYLIDHINSGIPIQNARQDASYFCLRTADNTYQFLGLDTGYNDHSPWDTYDSPPAPALKSSNDYKWAIDKIKHFNGKTIMLSHHQLFSHTGNMNSSKYGDSYANPHLYKHFAPFFHNKIATWFWGHEHSFALFKNGSFGLNQGRLVGSSSYEEAVSDNPYGDNFPMVPYADSNTFLATNPTYNNDHDAGSYYPHVGAIITMRTDNNPTVDYYKFPSWENGHAPSNPQLTLVTSEIIQNPTKSPIGNWTGNHKIKGSNMQSDHSPAIATIGDDLYMVYENTNDGKKIWWDNPSYDTSSGKLTSSPSKLPVDYTTTGSDKTPTTDKHPAVISFKGKLYLAYKDSDNTNLKWCVYDPNTRKWTKNGSINGSMTSNHGPSLAVFNNLLYCFYLSSSDNTKIKYGTFNGSTWTYQGNFQLSGSAVNSYHTVCPTVVSNSSNLFLIYAPNSSSHYLGLMRMDTAGVVHDMKNITNGETINSFIPHTSSTVGVCGDDRFIRILYKDHDSHSINWATLDLGFYDDQDRFQLYNLDQETPTWSGGLPVICDNNGDIPKTSVGPGYCMNDKHSFMVYSGNSSDQLWSAIQKNW